MAKKDSNPDPVKLPLKIREANMRRQWKELGIRISKIHGVWWTGTLPGRGLEVSDNNLGYGLEDMEALLPRNAGEEKAIRFGGISALCALRGAPPHFRIGQRTFEGMWGPYRRQVRR